MRVLVPFSVDDPKTRLSDTLDAEERVEFARVMLSDVLEAIRATGRDPELLTTASVDVDAPMTVDERPLTEAVNAALAGTEGPVAVVMADLALAMPAALDRLFAPDADVVLAPGRGGGTNALVARHPAFRVDYHGVSFRDHREAAAEIGAETAVVDSHRLATDVDERADLAEVLVHAEGEAAGWLRAAGFALSTDGGRVEVVRE
jgi:2-phospho-L-lactate guanylyltransferase